jgi:hypothetical protein
MVHVVYITYYNILTIAIDIFQFYVWVNSILVCLSTCTYFYLMTLKKVKIMFSLIEHFFIDLQFNFLT